MDNTIMNSKNTDIMDMKKPEKTVHQIVIERYSDIVSGEGASCSPCCGDTGKYISIEDLGRALDYTDEDLLLAPGEANLGLGCGNPLSLAELKPGETVLDIGSGAGFDAFLAARQVGASGKVIGIDMTPEMVAKATENAEKLKIINVDFRTGKIENLPLPDNSVDIVISNCVINLSPDKKKVFSEIYRVLKPGGRLVISDVVRSGEIPDQILNDPAAYTG